jgi:hypothetical protein
MIYDLETLKIDVSAWILNWVSKYNTQLETTPCPFARQALLTNKVDWHYSKSLSDLELKLISVAHKGLSNDVLIIGLDPLTIRATDLSQTIQIYNNKLLLPNDIVALEDHPDDVEYVNNVKMNHGNWALILLQNNSKLNSASEILRHQGYYKLWTPEQLDDVVNWRLQKDNNEDINSREPPLRNERVA